MSSASHVRYQTQMPPFVAFVAPTFYVGEAIYSGFDAVARLIGRGFKAFRVKMRTVQTVDTLTRLDNHTLTDIGIHRSQIGRVTRLVSENPGVEYHHWCR